MDVLDHVILAFGSAANILKGIAEKNAIIPIGWHSLVFWVKKPFNISSRHKPHVNTITESTAIPLLIYSR